jgi:hypothetical protein
MNATNFIEQTREKKAPALHLHLNDLMKSCVQSEQQLNNREKFVWKERKKNNQNKKQPRKKDLTQKSNGSRLDVIRVQILRPSQLFNSFLSSASFQPKRKSKPPFSEGGISSSRKWRRNRTKRPNGSTHWARKSALMNSSNCGVVLNLNISIANGLPSSSSSKGFLYLPPEYTGIQQLDFYWPLASNVCKTLSHLMFHFLRTKERTKWKRNEIGTADRGI